MLSGVINMFKKRETYFFVYLGMIIFFVAIFIIFKEIENDPMISLIL
ncbi:MAG: hypothetical protein K0Q49_1838 [Haloplasmataceae bacterium]|jgi:hypothetical protein|nr:hypothetical protein [Haloplasmataceae bacterium]